MAKIFDRYWGDEWKVLIPAEGMTRCTALCVRLKDMTVREMGYEQLRKRNCEAGPGLSFYQRTTDNDLLDWARSGGYVQESSERGVFVRRPRTKNRTSGRLK